MLLGETSTQWVVLTEIADWYDVYHAPVHLFIYQLL